MGGKQVIISIGREFGSGGHEIAETIAKRFDLPLYDYNLLREIANQKNINAANLEPYDEVPKKGFGSRTVKGLSNSPQENVAYMQFNFLKERARLGESFVVVGRCSEEILKEFPCLISFFILADEDVKIERLSMIYNLDKKKATDLMLEQNKKRKNYHNYFCQHKWGDSRNYDVSVNSSRLGIPETTNMIETFIRHRIELL